MINVYSSADVRDMDRAAIESGIPSLSLMDAAASALFDTLDRALSGIAGRRVVIFCGSGNNGGDGFALASLILGAGGNPVVIFVGDRTRMTPDCSAMCSRFIESDGEILEFTPDCLVGADACVDAMYGTGFRGKLTGDCGEAAKLMNRFPGFRLAADLPSGLYSDYGGMCEDAVCADATVTFSFPKPSCLLLPAAANCGRIIVADIGIPKEISDRYTPSFTMCDQSTLEVLPRRDRRAHKSHFGHALVVAGSARYTGAAYLAAEAAVRSGAGLVTAAVPAAIHSTMAVKLTEAMAYALPDQNALGQASLYDLLALCAGASAVLVGPGLGREEATAATVRDLASMLTLPVVFDADGINALIGHMDILSRMQQTPVLTPHDGEFARLFGAPPPDAARARVLTALEAAKKSGSVIVLKGYRTIIASPDGRVAVNPTGNPGMASGGSGDVLAGLVVSFRAQGIPAYEAACAAVWLHGAAGDECARTLSEYGMAATDLIRAVPRLLRGRNSTLYF
ncbi:MAG: NAD(P)H-hydrate dehydratase [Ruminococcaceae bacterium]|nr:NAD(P)H-hydrate dehydratase [Oscillospiraceae bacterium]